MASPAEGRATWQPLPLPAALRERVETVLGGIAAALAQAVESEPRPHTNGELALFFAYLARHSKDAYHAELSARFLERAAEELSRNEISPMLNGGFAGIAWIDHHLARITAGEPADSSDIDEVLLDLVSEPRWDDSYDLLMGLTGFGVYFLERLPDEVGRSGLEHVVRHLAALAVRTDRGITWHTPPERLTEGQREAAPDGYYNLGMAHGIPGIIALLSLIARQAEGPNDACTLLRGGADWLLSVRQPFTAGSYYRAWLPSLDAPAVKGRIAWCYGDPGPAVALVHAANALQDPALSRTATEMLLATCMGSNEELQITDAILCHGSAGLMHIYNRMGQHLGTPELRDAAVLWLERTLEFHAPGRYIGGFARYVPPPDRPFSTERIWEPAAGFLSGTAGIGLALIAAISDVDPAWDRLLLLS